MKNTFIIIGFIIVAIVLYVTWGNLSSRLVVIESTTGSYIYTDEVGNPEDELIDVEVEPFNVNLGPLLEQLAALETAQSENAKTIEAILKKLDEIAGQGCGTGNCTNKLVSREVVYFEHNDSKLSSEAMTTIDKLLENMSINAFVSLRGHADTSGDNHHNHLLSLKRAAAVKRYIDRKLSTDNKRNNLLMSIDGTGEESVVNATADDVEEPSNRIVEILVFE